MYVKRIMKTAVRKTTEDVTRRLVAQIRNLPGGAFMVLSVVLFAAIGTWLLVGSHAATPVTSFELENGSLAGTTSAVSDSSASGGGVVKFGTGGGGACSTSTKDPGGTDPWGGCWPGVNNTGVPSGTTLRRVPQDVTSGSGWSWDSADNILNVTGDNAMLDGLSVNAVVYVTSTGVTIKNSKVKAVQTAGNAYYCHSDESSAIRSLTGCTALSGVGTSSNDPRLIIQDSEVDYQGVAGDTGTCIGSRNINVLRVNIHGCENGFDADGYMIIQDSYIHDLYNSAVGDPHTDGLQSGVGETLTITHNVFYGFTTGCVYPNSSGSCNGTSAINIGGQPDQATSSNVVVSRNLLAGGAYTMYCAIKPPTNFNITQNYFSTVYSSRVGEYGPTSGCANGETSSGNVTLNYSTGQTTPYAPEN